MSHCHGEEGEMSHCHGEEVRYPTVIKRGGEMSHCHGEG